MNKEEQKNKLRIEQISYKNKEQSLYEFAKMYYDYEYFPSKEEVELQKKFIQICGGKLNEAVLILYFINHLHPKTEYYKHNSNFYKEGKNIAEELNISYAYFNKLIKKLEDKGLLHRSGKNGERKRRWHMFDKEHCRFCKARSNNKFKRTEYKVDCKKLPKEYKDCKNKIKEYYEDFKDQQNINDVIEFYQYCVSELFGINYDNELINSDYSYITTKKINIDYKECSKYLLDNLYKFAKKQQNQNKQPKLYLVDLFISNTVNN